MAVIALAAALLLSVDVPAPVFEADCLVNGLDAAIDLPVTAGEAATLEFELEGQNACRWTSTTGDPTAAELIRLPDSLEGPLLLEIETDLDATSALVANVAMLDPTGASLRLAPYTSFRERRGRRSIRVILRPDDVPGYLWVGAAPDAWPVIGRRNFRAATARTLSIIGLELGDDSTEYVASRQDGEVRIRVESFAPPVVP